MTIHLKQATGTGSVAPGPVIAVSAMVTGIAKSTNDAGRISPDMTAVMLTGFAGEPAVPASVVSDGRTSR